MNTVVSNPFLQIPQVTSNFPFIFHLYYYNILNIVNFRKMEVYMEESRFVILIQEGREYTVVSNLFLQIPSSFLHLQFSVQYIRILLILER